MNDIEKAIRDAITNGEVMTTKDLPDYRRCRIRLVSVHFPFLEKYLVGRGASSRQAIEMYRGEQGDVWFTEEEYDKVESQIDLVYSLTPNPGIEHEIRRSYRVFVAQRGYDDKFIIDLFGKKITRTGFRDFCIFQICGEEVVVGVTGWDEYSETFLIGKNGEPIKGEYFPFERSMLRKFLHKQE